jgi:hypothetical protein
MDYKRAYEELREVYLKDKQVADELAELVRVHLSLLDKQTTRTILKQVWTPTQIPLLNEHYCRSI